jgi:RNA polymerase sigma-70 factor (ECF subfamily)
VQDVFDRAWRERALAGDREAVALLADNALQPLYAFCFYRVGRNRHLCEEVVQETALRALRQLASYDPVRAGNRIFGWLQGLARNEIRRVLKGRKEAVSLDALWSRMDGELMDVYAKLEKSPFDDELLERAETREMVNATMSQLPPHYRQALEEKYLDGKSVRDIARTLSVSEKSVESLLTRARRAFRATFLALGRNLGAQPAL